jgi:DNA-binding MarR family transcriptional regulator/cytochrome c556
VRALGLTPAQFDIVATLGNTPGLSFRELGERTLITKGTLTGVVDRLEARGLVERVASDHDRRSVTVRLTAAGDASSAGVRAPRRAHPARLRRLAPGRSRRARIHPDAVARRPPLGRSHVRRSPGPPGPVPHAPATASGRARPDRPRRLHEEVCIAASVAAAALIRSPRRRSSPSPRTRSSIASPRFSLMGAHMGRLGAMVNGRVPYDAKVAPRRAAARDAVRLPGGAFPQGSESGMNTKAKPEIWKDNAKFTPPTSGWSATSRSCRPRPATRAR